MVCYKEYANIKVISVTVLRKRSFMSVQYRSRRNKYRQLFTGIRNIIGEKES